MQRRVLADIRLPEKFHALIAAALLGACATYEPERLTFDTDLDGMQTKSTGDVTVSVAILTDEQAAQHFGVDFAKLDLQALWVRVRNETSEQLWFIRNAVDPDFYSADEAAVVLKSAVPHDVYASLRQHLRDESIRVQHRPMTISEGFLYLPHVEGGRYVDIRLAGDVYDADVNSLSAATRDGAHVGASLYELRFGFAVPLPDGYFDYENLDTAHTYGDTELPDLDTETLRARLAELPCCATDENGNNNGDPLNAVIVGNSQEVLTALTRSGWSFTHRLSFDTVRRTVGAAMSGNSYPVAPVSSLFVFGRRQDFALQRARTALAQRNHMRFWLAPYTYQGRQVWVGQVSRDIAIKPTANSPFLTTHVIDPEVDLTREYLLHSLLNEGLVGRFGFVEGGVQASPDDPALNLAGDPYFSDGLRLVVVVSPHPLPYSEVRSLRWERSSAPIADGQSESAERYVRPVEAGEGTADPAGKRPDEPE